MNKNRKGKLIDLESESDVMYGLAVGTLLSISFSIVIIFLLEMIRYVGGYLRDVMFFIVIVLAILFFLIDVVGLIMVPLGSIFSQKKNFWIYFVTTLLAIYLFLMVMEAFPDSSSNALRDTFGDVIPEFPINVILLIVFSPFLLLVQWDRQEKKIKERELAFAFDKLLEENYFFRLDFSDRPFLKLVEAVQRRNNLSSRDEVLRLIVDKRLSDDVDYVVLDGREKKRRKSERTVYFKRIFFKEMLDYITVRLEQAKILTISDIIECLDYLPEHLLIDILIAKHEEYTPFFEIIAINHEISDVFLISSEAKKSLLAEIERSLQDSGMAWLKEISKKVNVPEKILSAMVKSREQFSTALDSDVIIIGDRLLTTSLARQLFQSVKQQVQKRKVVSLSEILEGWSASDLLRLLHACRDDNESTHLVRLSCNRTLLYDWIWFQEEIISHIMAEVEREGITNLRDHLDNMGLPHCEWHLLYREIMQNDDSVIIDEATKKVVSRRWHSRKIEVFFSKEGDVITKTELLNYLQVPESLLPSIIEFFIQFTSLPVVLEKDEHETMVLRILKEFIQFIEEHDGFVVRMNEITQQFHLNLVRIKRFLKEHSEDHWQFVLGSDLMVRTETLSDPYHSIGNLVEDAEKGRLIELNRIKSVFDNVVDGSAIIRHVILRKNLFLSHSRALTIQLTPVSSLWCDFHEGEFDGSQSFHACKNCRSRYCMTCMKAIRSVAVDSCINCNGRLQAYPTWCPRCFLIIMPMNENWISRDEGICPFCNLKLQHAPLSTIIEVMKARLDDHGNRSIRKAIQIMRDFRTIDNVELNDLLQDLSNGYPISRERLHSALSDWTVGVVAAWLLGISRANNQEQVVIVLGNYGFYFRAMAFRERCNSCDDQLLLSGGYQQCRQCQLFFCTSCASNGCPHCQNSLYLRMYPLFCSDCPNTVTSHQFLMKDDNEITNCKMCGGYMHPMRKDEVEDDFLFSALNHARRRLLNEIFEQLTVQGWTPTQQELEHALQNESLGDTSYLLAKLKEKMRFHGLFLVINEENRVHAVSLDVSCQLCYEELNGSQKVYSCRDCGRYVCFDCKKPFSRCSYCNGVLRVFPVECPSCQVTYFSPLELVKRMRCPRCQKKCRPIASS